MIRNFLLMDRLTNFIYEFTGITPDLQEKLFGTIITFLVLWLLKSFVLKILRKQTNDIRFLYRWRKTISYIAYGIGIIIIGQIWFQKFESLATFFGLLSAGLAVALKDPLANLAGWAFIMWRKPFSVGDRIQVGDVSGDVIDIRLFQFSLIEIGNWVDAEQSTGRVIHVPNGKVFFENQANYTEGFNYIWNEIPVLITFESNWRKAKEILSQIISKRAMHLSAPAEKRVREAAQKYMIFYNKLTPIVYTSVKDHGVMLTIRYICDPRGRRGSVEVIWEDVLDAFGSESDIDFAYPTRRIFDNISEGKSGARAEPLKSPEK